MEVETVSFRFRRWQPDDIVLVALVPYACVVICWLFLGALPTLAHVWPQFSGLLQHIETSNSALSGPAGRILAHANETAVSTVVVEYIFSLLNLALGLLLIVKRPRERVVQLLALALLGTAATFNSPSHAVFHVIGQPAFISAAHFMFHIVSGVAYLWAVVVFPDGDLPPGLPGRPRQYRLGAVAATGIVGVISWRGSFVDHPIFFVVFFGALISGTAFVAQTLRIAGSSDLTARQQARVFRASLVPAMVAACLWLVAWAVSRSSISTVADATGLMHRIEDVFPALFVLVPAMLVVSILRYRLWQIDTLLSRTLLYATLAVAISGCYVVVITAAGPLFGNGLVFTVVAGGILVVAIEPLRLKLDAMANRIVFGQTLTPSQAMERLADGLTVAGNGQGLQDLADVAVEATRAVSSRIWLAVGDRLLVAAASPVDTPGRRSVPIGADGISEIRSDLLAGHGVCVPVRHQGRTIGVLALSFPPHEHLTALNKRLASDLAAHAGLLVRNAQLMAELENYIDRLHLQTAELQRSRRRVVAQHDIERHRLERNLHDGAQQELVAFLVALRSVSAVLTSGVGARARVVDELKELREMIGSTYKTVHELCEGEIPALIKNSGLAQALAVAVRPASRAGVAVRLHCVLDEEKISLDVAAVVYFCCTEALQNALKYASGAVISIDVQATATQIWFEVNDSGQGFDPANARHGSGMSSMAERLADAGGTLMVRSGAGSGTVIHGALPLRPVITLARSGDMTDVDQVGDLAADDDEPVSLVGEVSTS